MRVTEEVKIVDSLHGAFIVHGESVNARSQINSKEEGWRSVSHWAVGLPSTHLSAGDKGLLLWGSSPIGGFIIANSPGRDVTMLR